MNLPVHDNASDALQRLHEAANLEGATMASVSTKDLRQLLASVAHDNRGNTQLSTLHIGNSERGLVTTDAPNHQHRLIGQALGECIAAAGIVRDGVGLSGQELLLLSDDLKDFIAGAEQSIDAYNAVISYVLDNPFESPMEFLRCWNEGSFESLRQEWPDAPQDIYLADTQHPDFKGLGVATHDVPKQLVGTKLLFRCRDLIASNTPDAVSTTLLEELTAYLNEQPTLTAADSAASGVRDDLTPDGAYIQYQAAATALSEAVHRAYPAHTEVEVKIGRHVIEGEVVFQRKFMGSTPGEFFIRNKQTGSVRKVTHGNVVAAQATRANQSPPDSNA